MRKLIVNCFVFVILLLPKTTYSSHAAGLDITYECISANQYKVTLTFYRECSGLNGPNGNWLNGVTQLDVFSPSTGSTALLDLVEVTPFPVPVNPTISSSPSCPFIGTCSFGGTTPQNQVKTFEGISEIVLGKRSASELGGPIMIASVASKAAENGLESYLFIMAIISINLGLINLFPIPMLDGGHLLLYAVQAVTKKAINDVVLKYYYGVGILILLSLMIFVNYNDLIKQLN